MEVHAHTHTARKKWTHYFWEFLMLFLAVFCGFLAEYKLEHTIEHQREEQYMRSMIEDLKSDIGMLEKNVSLSNITARDIMSPNPKTISQNDLAVAALDLMRKNNISQLLVVGNNKYEGIIHLHDLIREGII